MGRHARVDDGRTTLRLDPHLKRRATLYAIRRSLTLTALVEEGLRLVMTQGKDRKGGLARMKGSTS